MKRTLTIEHFLYLLAFLVGLFLRFYRLGLPTLSESEAGWALQALEIARGGAPQVGSQPAYVLLTSLLFWLIDSSNFLARLLPALAGSLLVILPYSLHRLFQGSDWLRKAGLVMAFGIALDPGLVAVSRQVGSPIPAVMFLLFTIVMVIQRRWVWAGILAGLALLSGPEMLTGIVGLLLAWAFIRGLAKLGWLRVAQLKLDGFEGQTIPWSKVLLALGVTILAAGLLFLRVPQGLNALAQTIPDYLDGWFKLGEVPGLRLPAALLIYQPLALLFGLVAAGRGWWAAKSGTRSAYLAILLSLWAFASFLVTVLYPARQVADLSWTLIPLWALAALEISRHLSARENQTTRLVAFGLAGLVLLLMVISWINLLTLVRTNGNPVLYSAVIIGALLMAGIATLLVAAGWSYSAARLGFTWGVLLGLGLGMLSSMIGLSQLRANNVRELWSMSPAPGQLAELEATLSDLSKWQTGFSDQIDVVVTANANVLRWALRDIRNVTYASSPDVALSPAIMITWKEQESPTLAHAYRGQDLILQWYPGWEGALPTPLLPWLTSRQAPLAQLQVVLWARADIFPGGLTGLLEQIPADEAESIPVEQLIP